MSEQVGKFESAFPCEGGPNSGLHPDPGMSLRDWFAGQALPAVIADHVAANVGHEIDYADVAAGAYGIADEMIAARTVPEQVPPDAEARGLLAEALPLLNQLKLSGPALSDPPGPPTELIERIRAVLR